MSEFWDISVKRVTLEENNIKDTSVGDFRLKLMEVADKVEAGVYTAATLNLVAANFDEQVITTGQISVSQLADGNRCSGWVEIQAEIPDGEDFRAAYDAFIDDTILMYSMNTIDDSERVNCEVVHGNNRSDGDTTRYVEE